MNPTMMTILVGAVFFMLQNKQKTPLPQGVVPLAPPKKPSPVSFGGGGGGGPLFNAAPSNSSPLLRFIQGLSYSGGESYQSSSSSLGNSYIDPLSMPTLDMSQFNFNGVDPTDPTANQVAYDNSSSSLDNTWITPVDNTTPIDNSIAAFTYSSGDSGLTNYLADSGANYDPNAVSSDGTGYTSYDGSSYDSSYLAQDPSSYDPSSWGG